MSIDVHTLSSHGRSIRVGIRPAAGERPGARPLVVFNGLGASMDLLLPFVHALDDRLVLIFDAPGIGTAPPRAPYLFASLASQVEAYLAALLPSDETVEVMGVSWGGCLAQQFCLQYPGRCARLVLAATSPGVLMVPGNFGSMIGRLARRLFAGKAQAPRRFHGPWWGGHRAAPLPWQAESAELLSEIYQLLALSCWTSLPWLTGLRQPTLLLAGRDDELVPLVNAQLMALLVPDARLSIVAGGHEFLISQAQESAGRVESFLATARSARAG